MDTHCGGFDLSAFIGVYLWFVLSATSAFPAVGFLLGFGELAGGAARSEKNGEAGDFWDRITGFTR